MSPEEKQLACLENLCWRHEQHQIDEFHWIPMMGETVIADRANRWDTDMSRSDLEDLRDAGFLRLDEYWANGRMRSIAIRLTSEARAWYRQKLNAGETQPENPLLQSGTPQVIKPGEAPATDVRTFSVRHGYVAPHSQTPITIREEAPIEVRSMVLEIVSQFVFDSDALFDIAARIGKQSWESSEPRESGTPSRVQLQRLVSKWDWFLLYDFIERLYTAMEQWEVQGDGRPEDDFEERLNSYFQHAGVGWQLQNGKVTSRGSEAFEVAIHRAIPALKETGLQAAEREIPTRWARF